MSVLAAVERANRRSALIRRQTSQIVTGCDGGTAIEQRPRQRRPAVVRQRSEQRIAGQCSCGCSRPGTRRHDQIIGPKHRAPPPRSEGLPASRFFAITELCSVATVVCNPAAIALPPIDVCALLNAIVLLLIVSVAPIFATPPVAKSELFAEIVLSTILATAFEEHRKAARHRPNIRMIAGNRAVIDRDRPNRRAVRQVQPAAEIAVLPEIVDDVICTSPPGDRQRSRAVAQRDRDRPAHA